MPHTRLDAADAVWFAVERPQNRMVITAVLRLDGLVDVDRLRLLVQERLVASYPRLSQRVVRSRLPLAPRRWQDDPAFDLRRHLHVDLLDATLGGQGLQDLVGDLLGRPLDGSRPPWELHVVGGADDRGALVARFHHSLADGRALAEVLLRLTDDAGDAGGASTEDAGPAATEDPGRASTEHAGGGSTEDAAASREAPRLRPWQLPRAVVHVVLTLLQVASYVGEPRTALRGRLGTAKRAAWTEPHDLDDVRRVADARDASINDVLLAALAGGLRRHAERCGDRPQDVRVVVPADLRAGAPVGRGLGNRFGMVLVQLPVSEPDRAARLRRVVDRTSAVKRSTQAVSTYLLLRVAGWLPRPVPDAAAALLGAAASAVVTNVPGPRQPLSLLGRRLRSLVFWVPQVGRIGVGISVFSYSGTVTVGVAADARLAVDPATLAADVDAEITALAASAGC
ncbi:MAG TPA: wax ester/triacylglycerol synthase family O-acyltransferase [Actinomycetales bacterium]|nr:wax ester/triacylglycerol synthase family O-acyltransferase [Actinomycetales bacterium]